MKTTPFEVKFRPVESLIPYARNARTHNPKQLLLLARSLVEYGWTNPVLVDAQGGIIAGHGRVMAAQLIWESGIEARPGDPSSRIDAIANVPRGQIPTVLLANLTEVQRRAYIIADNKLAELAGWDQDLLTMELGSLAEDGFRLDLTGFSDAELSNLLGDGPRTGQEDEAPAAPAIATSRRGDLWHLGDHRVLCGDALDPSDYGILLREGPAHALWTDPPYNVDYQGGSIENDDLGAEYPAFLAQALTRAYGALVEGGPVYVAHADTEGLTVRRAFSEAGFKLSGCLIWVKDSVVLGRSDYQWRHEPILYGWKPGAAHPWHGGRKQTTVLEMAGQFPAVKCADGTTQMVMGDYVLIFTGDVEVREVVGTVFHEDRPRVNNLHPTMKPVALIERHLKNHLVAGEVVLDNFGGSGSTLIACERLGLQGRMLEISPALVDVIVMRWQGYTRKIARLEDGRSFDEVQAVRATA